MTSPSTLRAALSPRSVAVIGASENPNKIGGRPIHYLGRFGFGGARPNYFFDFGKLPRRNHWRFGFNDSGFLASNFRDRIAKPLLMIERDWSDDRDV